MFIKVENKCILLKSPPEDQISSFYTHRSGKQMKKIKIEMWEKLWAVIACYSLNLLPRLTGICFNSFRYAVFFKI